MNSSTPDFEDGFEAELASFQRAELPPAWREDLLAKAIPAPVIVAMPRRRFITRADRLMACAIVLIWAGIIGLRFSQPGSERIYSQSTPKASSAHLEPFSSSPKNLPMLAWRAHADSNLDTLFTP